MAKHVCPQCNATFSRKNNRDRHVVRIHTNANLTHPCNICGNVFSSVVKLKEHRLTHDPKNGFVLYSSAFKKSCTIMRKTYKRKIDTLDLAYQLDKIEMYDLINFELNKRRSMKTTIVYHAEFLKALDDAENSNIATSYIVCFRCNSEQLYTKSNIP